MLAFDIETEGLNKLVDRITVAGVYEPENGIKQCYNFLRGTPEEIEANKQAFLDRLDSAETICAFHGAGFDLPFIIHRFAVPPERYGNWFVKLFDYFEVCKLVFASSCSLNKLLEANGIETKSSCGLQAIEWAREGRWEELEDYCMTDTVLTHVVSSMDQVAIPLTRKGLVVCCRQNGLLRFDRP